MQIASAVISPECLDSKQLSNGRDSTLPVMGNQDNTGGSSSSNNSNSSNSNSNSNNNNNNTNTNSNNNNNNTSSSSSSSNSNSNNNNNTNSNSNSNNNNKRVKKSLSSFCTSRCSKLNQGANPTHFKQQKKNIETLSKTVLVAIVAMAEAIKPGRAQYSALPGLRGFIQTSMISTKK